MISKKDILKMAKSVTRQSRGYAKHKPVHPHREWFIGLSIFVAVVFVGGAFNVQTHRYYNTLESNVDDTTAPAKKYRHSAAVTADTIYTERLENFNTLANAVPVQPVVTLDDESAEVVVDEEEPPAEVEGGGALLVE